MAGRRQPWRLGQVEESASVSPESRGGAGPAGRGPRPGQPGGAGGGGARWEEIGRSRGPRGFPVSKLCHVTLFPFT